MKFSGTMYLMAILNVNKKPGLYPLSKKHSFTKTTEEGLN